MPGPNPTAIDLSIQQRKELELLRNGRKKRPKQRAEIVLLAAAGQNNAEIAEMLGASVTTVRKWRDRFAADGVPGLHSDKRMGRSKDKLELSDAESDELHRLARRATTSQRLALRARIVLRCSEGTLNQDVADELGCSAATVGKWRQRFVDDGIDGLVDEPRPGAPRKVGDEMVEELVVRTLETSPQRSHALEHALDG